MVSTRHNMTAGETLVSLDMTPTQRSATRSPSPLKRKADLETPEQSFVDARATPFTQRKRRSTRNDNDDHDTADEELTESTASSHTLLLSPTLTGTMAVASEIADRNAFAIGNQSKDDDESSDDDEAPEAISNTASAQFAQATEQNRKETLLRRAEVEKAKRRDRDRKLREQKESQRGPALTAKTIPEEDETNDTTETPSSSVVQRTVIPRMLPDEILNAPQNVVASSQVAPNDRPIAVHKRFEIKKEPTVARHGPLTVKLLKRDRKSLAPKTLATIANTKSQWLYQRGEHNKNRRPVKKPLA